MLNSKLVIPIGLMILFGAVFGSRARRTSPLVAAAPGTGPLPNPFTDLPTSRQYLLERLDESKTVIGTPLGFVGVCIVLEVLVKAANGTGPRNLGEREYVNFIQDWMPERYANFRYQSGIHDLPSQMYAVLRSGLVHGLSFIPLPGRRGRDRSIWIEGHRSQSTQAHLTQFSRPPNVGDACYIVGEDFLDDVAACTRSLFSTIDPALQEKIQQHFRTQPMIVV